MPFQAKYEGMCLVCQKSIRKGEVIERELDGYAHVGCEYPNKETRREAEYAAKVRRHVRVKEDYL